MLEAVVNVSDGRRPAVLDGLRNACGAALLDHHCDVDHDRSVFTLVGASPTETEASVRRLADAVTAGPFDLADSHGVHPRLGILDVVPFVTLERDDLEDAPRAARTFGEWLASTHGVPVFFYDGADPGSRTLPALRRNAFRSRRPDLGPPHPHPHLGATAVGARAPMIAVNLELASADLELARGLARAVRERDGGLAGVRALGFPLATVGRVQVSMNLVDLAATGLEMACTRVRDLARGAGTEVARVEIVGLIPASELACVSPDFSAWSGVTAARTIEAAMARVVDADGAAPDGSSADGSSVAGPPGP